MKLQNKFALTILPLVVGPLLLLGAYAYYYLHQSSQTKAFSQLQQTVNNLNNQLLLEQKQLQANSHLLVTDSVLNQYAVESDELSRVSVYQKPLLKRFRSYLEAYPHYLYARFILPDGYEETYWGAIGYPNDSDDESGAEWFTRMKEENLDVISFLQKKPILSLSIYHAVRLKNNAVDSFNKEASLRGFLSLTADISWFAQAVEEVASEDDIQLAWLDNDDTLVFSSPDFPTDDVSLSRLIWDQQSLNLSQVTLNKQSYYCLFSKTISGRLLIALLPASQITAVTNSLSLSLLIITLLAILISSVFILLLLRQSVLVPLERLGLASKKIGLGESLEDVQLGDTDEFKQLSVNFGEMSRQLEDNSERIRFIAYHDSLTELPNRRMFQYLLNNNLASAARSNELLALFFLDIDHFKTINDSLGHDIGDELLREFASRISHCLRQEDALLPLDLTLQDDLVARLGGDEFTIVLPRIKHAFDAGVVAKRIVKSMEEAFYIDDHELHITTSIGITIYPADGNSVDELVKCADIAMYHAKNMGRNNFQYFTDDLNAEISDRVERENELRAAIEKGQLILHYQPQINIKNNQVCGVEALVRWLHPEKGLIPPFRFITLAEETGMIVELGEWVLRESCLQAMSWLNKGMLDFRVSVNVSSIQFQRQDISELVKQVLKETGLPARYLTIEVTESIIVSADDENLSTLKQLKELGVQISMDDFGTGYSSLSYLRLFPIDSLKIDRSFIIEACKQDEVKAIISAIITMAHALNLKVVAEGVEELEQLTYLMSLDCDVIQGYYYSKPISNDELEVYLQQNRAELLIAKES